MRDHRDNLGRRKAGLMVGLAIVCALLGATCSAIGAQLQHIGVRAEIRDASVSHARAVGRLLRNPSWWRGVAVLVPSAACQVCALTLAPVTVVAPIGVLSVPIVALLNARAVHQRLSRITWLAVFASTLAVGVFVAIAAVAATRVDVHPGAVLRAGWIVVAAVVILCVVAVASRRIVRCLALATGAGVSYGLASVLIRAVASTVLARGLGTLHLASLLGLVVAVACGTCLVQLGFASGPPDLVVGTQTLASPVVATAIGMRLLGETAGAHGGIVAALMVCGVVAASGVAVLARHHFGAMRDTAGVPRQHGGRAVVAPPPLRAEERK